MRDENIRKNREKSDDEQVENFLRKRVIFILCIKDSENRNRDQNFCENQNQCVTKFHHAIISRLSNFCNSSFFGKLKFADSAKVCVYVAPRSLHGRKLLNRRSRGLRTHLQINSYIILLKRKADSRHFFGKTQSSVLNFDKSRPLVHRRIM